MRLGAFVFALILTTGSVSSPGAAAVPVRVAQPAWRIAHSQHFDIHYPPELAPQLDRITRAAEHAYRDISGRLNFVLPTKVPVVLFTPSGPLTREQVVAYATGDTVAPQVPHRSRIVLPMPEVDSQIDQIDLTIDARIVHELTHLLVSEIIAPGRSGDGGVPRWVHEGMANYMVAAWPDDQDRLMRDLVASGDFPALPQLTSGAAVANAPLTDALGHAVFDFIESRWGAAGIRRFLDALAAPRARDPYEAAFDHTPAAFEADFREYAVRRFSARVR